MTMHLAAADLADLADPSGRPQSILLASQRDKIRTALERAHHALATLHGLTVCDKASDDGADVWTIDETETLAAIDAALSLVPEGPAVLRVVSPSTLDPA